jgi:hypothetical protein
MRGHEAQRSVRNGVQHRVTYSYRPAVQHTVTYSYRPAVQHSYLSYRPAVQHTITYSYRPAESSLRDNKRALQTRIINPTPVVCLNIIQKCGAQLTVNTKPLNYKK